MKDRNRNTSSNSTSAIYCLLGLFSFPFRYCLQTYPDPQKEIDNLIMFKVDDLLRFGEMPPPISMDGESKKLSPK